MVVTARSRAVAPTTPARTRAFHLGLVMLMAVIVGAGFWPYYAALPTGGTDAPWVIHVHAAVFSGWILLLLTQVTLVYRRRVRTHQRVGIVGAWFGLIVLLLGLVVTVVAPVLSVTEGRATLDEAAGFLILPIGDMMLFAGFFAAGIAYRRRKELHKRLMILASVALIFPAAARFAFEAGFGAVLALWLAPLLLAIGHDALVLRRVERVYVVGLALMLVAFTRVMLMESEAWLVIGRRILGVFLPAA